MLPLFLTLLTLTFVAAQPSPQQPFPAYTPSDPPLLRVTAEQWNTLNASVNGRLFPGVPFAHSCFSNNSAAECIHLQKNYKNEIFRSASPGGMINTQWETCQARGEGCLLDFADPANPAPCTPPRKCHLGSVSNYYIDVREAGDVAAAFKFVRGTGVPLVIKNTGHDYKGRSSAPFSLCLWTHNLQEMTYNPAFTPACLARTDADIAPVPAVSLGAGIQWFQAYDFADEHNITLVGGADRTVGAVGGWLQGGGHGALSNTLGMGADRVIEFEVVTPDGERRIVNRCQNEDLFFALRGGGGGTFALVLRATALASPQTPIQALLVEFPPALQQNNSAGNLTLTAELWSVLLANALPWAREGWGAYVTATSALYLNPVLSPQEATESMEPLLKWAEELRERAPGKGVLVVQGAYASWKEAYDVFADDNSADLGQPIALSSRLIPSTALTSPSSRSSLLAALLAAEHRAPGVRLLHTMPYNYAAREPAPALRAAWRTAVVHVTAVGTWAWDAAGEGEAVPRRVYERVRGAMAGVREVVRRVSGGEEGAAYVNEVDVYEDRWEETFWGEHYPRLLEIKRKYDPDHLLDCWQCVGWDRHAQRFSCYL